MKNEFLIKGGYGTSILTHKVFLDFNVQPC
jgi:hypothetical protein